MNQVHSLRGTIAAKTRSVIFVVFGENNLPTINTNASPSEIAKWKRKPEVSACFKRLFEKMDENERSPTILALIIERVLGKNFTNVEAAFVVVVGISILDPKYSKLKLSEKSMKERVKYYLVCFINLK